MKYFIFNHKLTIFSYKFLFNIVILKIVQVHIIKIKFNKIEYTLIISS